MANNTLLNIFQTLDAVSEFSRGKPLNENISNQYTSITSNSISKSKVHNRKNIKHKEDRRNEGKSLEEEEYARQIGYEFDDNEDLDDCDNYITNNDFNDKDENYYSSICKKPVENSFCQKSLNVSGFNSFNQKDFKNGFSVGRGRWLNVDNGNIPHSMYNRNKVGFHHNRTEQNDRVISEQLREVVGVGISNEEIENGFALKFKKQSENENEKTILNNNRKDEDYVSDGIESIDSNNSRRRKEFKCKQSLYVPPPLRSNSDEDNKSKTVSVIRTSCNNSDIKCDDMVLPFFNDNNNVELKRENSPVKLGATKVNNIYELSDESIGNININKQININSNNELFFNNNGSILNNEKPKNNVLLNQPNISFRMVSKEFDKKSSSGGRNALINGLLKKIAIEDHEKENIIDIKEDKNVISVNKLDDKEESNGKVFENYNAFKDNSCNYDLSSNDDYSSVSGCSRSLSRNSVTSPSNLNVMTSATNVSNNDLSNYASTLSCNTYTTNASSIGHKPMKTYVEHISKQTKKKSLTIADFITDNSLNNDNTYLNPNAVEYTPPPPPPPHHFNNLNPNAEEFSPLNLSFNSDERKLCFNDINFPPLK